MQDEYVSYVQNEPQLHASIEDHRIRVYGKRTGDQAVELLGFSFHYPQLWNEFQDVGDHGTLESITRLSELSGKPLIWIGERDVDWRNNSGEVELGKMSLRNGALRPSIFKVPISDCSNHIQDLFETDLSSIGSKKGVNVRTSPFQEWGMNYLPSYYVPNDIDLLVSDKNNRPTGFIEIKRSDWGAPPRPRPIKDWRPFREDWRNYYLQKEVCDAARILPVIIQHKKERVTDDSIVGYYRIQEIDIKKGDWIDYNREIISASRSVVKLKNL